MVNVERLEKAMDRVETAAILGEGWDQHNWRCGSGMCYAGFAVDNARAEGFRWLAGAKTGYAMWVVIPDDFEVDPTLITTNILPKAYDYTVLYVPETIAPAGLRVASVSYVAEKLLGVPRSFRMPGRGIANLFRASNDVEDLRQMTKFLIEREQAGE